MEIDWTSWFIYLSSILRNGLGKAVPQEEEIRGPPTLSMPPEKVKGLTAKDIELIDLFLKKFNNTMQDLGKDTGCDIRTVSKARKKLLSSGIFQSCLNVEHIGLNEHLLLIVESDLDNLYSITFALKRLPKVWIYWTKSPKGNSSLACLLETPSGSITSLQRVLRQSLRHLADYKLFFVYNLEESGLNLQELFDPQTKTWRVEPEILQVKKSEISL